jgi:hypothetical protein
MRGAPKSTKTAAQRRAAQIAATRRWTERRSLRFLAQGLTTTGQPRKQNQPLSPRMRTLLAAYLRKLKRAARPVKLSPQEAAWRAERAAMGNIEVPEIKLYSMGRGETET